VAGLPEVFGRVLVRAGIAAPDVSAGQAHPEVGPGILPVVGAFLAASRVQRRRIYDAYGVLKMLT